MKPAERIVAALTQNPPTAELLSRLAPEVQENIKGGWLRVIEEGLISAPPEPTAPAISQPAPEPTLVESTGQNAAVLPSPVADPAAPVSPDAAVPAPAEPPQS